MYVATYPDSDTLSHQAAQFTIRIAAESLVTHGRFMIALAGGSTPKKLYALLASEPYRDQLDWALVEVFWSDERCVPPDDSESNFRMAQETLLSKVPIPASQIHRMPADQSDHEAASQAYITEMRHSFGTGGIPGFDLILARYGTGRAHCFPFPTPAIFTRARALSAARDNPQATARSLDLHSATFKCGPPCVVPRDG